MDRSAYFTKRITGAGKILRERTVFTSPYLANQIYAESEAAETSTRRSFYTTSTVSNSEKWQPVAPHAAWQFP